MPEVDRKNNCECGGKYYTSNKSKHYNTQKHKMYEKMERNNFINILQSVPYYQNTIIFNPDEEFLKNNMSDINYEIHKNMKNPEFQKMIFNYNYDNNCTDSIT